jgi:hypothetical protein
MRKTSLGNASLRASGLQFLDNPLSRRSLLQGIASAAALGSLGTAAAVSEQAKAASGDRKFLFFFAGGGWDATPLDPKYGEDGISAVSGTDMDPDTVLGKAGNLTWASGMDRRNMDRWFHRWGAGACIVRGVNIHSAGHEAGMKWMMTGSSSSSIPDWPTILASNGAVEYPMPHLVFSGPAYPGNLGAAVVRGGGGTLLDLIDGSINGYADAPSPVPAAPMQDQMDRYVFDQTAKFASVRDGACVECQGTIGRLRVDDLENNIEKAMELKGRRFEAGLGHTGNSMLDQSMMALEVMRLGLSRCAMIGIPGGWDTHGGNQAVGPQLDSFFLDMDAIMEHLVSTPGNSAPWLIDEVTIVCMSELGRTPKFNGSMGRDHWPWTSMLIAGSGIKGNNVVGWTDEGLIAGPTDLATGQPSNDGVGLGSEHVGTAILKLGKVDPERYLPGVPPALAILKDPD